MSQRFNDYFKDYEHTPEQRAAMLAATGRLMVAIIFDKPIIVVGEDFDSEEAPARDGELDVSALMPRFQKRDYVRLIDVPYLIPEEVRHWHKHPNYKDIDLRAAVEERHLAFGIPFFEQFGEFFQREEESGGWVVELGKLVCLDQSGLVAAAREWLQAYRDSEHFDAEQAALNMQRDATTYIGFVENGVLDEHERTHTLKSAHLYFMRMFRWLPLPEAADGYALWQQTQEEDFEYVNELTSDWPQLWPCTVVDDPDDLLDRLFPIVQTDKDLGAFGNDAHGGYCIYLPRYVLAQYTFDC